MTTLELQPNDFTIGYFRRRFANSGLYFRQGSYPYTDADRRRRVMFTFEAREKSDGALVSWNESPVLSCAAAPVVRRALAWEAERARDWRMV